MIENAIRRVLNEGTADVVYNEQKYESIEKMFDGGEFDGAMLRTLNRLTH